MLTTIIGLALLSSGPDGISLLEYQTLFAALVAAAVGVVTVWLLNRQLRQSVRVEEERLDRRQRANRALLPVHLSEACEYAADCIAVLKSVELSADDDDGNFLPTPQDVGSGPLQSREMLVGFANCIEDGPVAVSAQLEKLVALIQINNSRFDDFVKRIRQDGDLNDGEFLIDHYVHTHLADAVEIYGRASNLFDYARGETNGEVRAIDFEFVWSSSLRLVGLSWNYDEVREILNRRFADGRRLTLNV